MKPPERIVRELTVRWLALAHEDLEAAEQLLSLADAPLYPIGFHAQQAAEKFLKALLVRHQVEFSKTHDIAELLALLAPKEKQLTKQLAGAESLTPFGVQHRYPGDYPSPSRKEVSRALALAQQVRASVEPPLQKWLAKGAK